MILLFKSLCHTALLGVMAFALGSPLADGLRPAAVDAHLTAFHAEAARSFSATAFAAPAPIGFGFIQGPAERAVENFLARAL